MSSERDRPVEPGSSQKPRTHRPTASIARSISWSYWWRKMLAWLFLDILVVAALAYGFAARCNATVPPSAADGGNSWAPGKAVRYEGSGLDVSTWKYVVEGADGKLYEFSVADELGFVGPALCVIALFELGDLLGFFSDTRRVRRKLQPLNDLAIMAESLGSAGVSDPMGDGADSDSKMATLEQAISRASVDSPTVSTGDTDLRSIEVALNGLLRQMQDAKLQQMRFVSDASHELRTPIAVIQGYVNMLDRWGTSDPDVLHESIEALKSESEHMQELVEQLLFLARGDSGRNTLQKTTFNLAEIVREVWDESVMIDGTHVYECALTEADAADAHYQVTGDLAMVKQSLRIVVQNAEKYSPAGTTIKLNAAADRTGVTCSVQDEGIGMSEQDAAHVFERFYRAEGARSEGTPGTGLGLSIAKWIVDAHGGTIEVLSREGVGTRFTLHYPH